MSVVRLGEMQAAEGKTDELGDFLLSIVPIITGSEGCVSCQLLHNQDDPTKFVMIEVWESAEFHQASVKNIPPEKLTAIRPLLGGPPSGSYYTDETVRGAS
ncbi:MAG: antibiotic biosynthesis monooxygenase [Caldilineaceae bacterium]|nr:antibiotic biosynthesis monooxygenase [Caldilineaceae bacterium]